MGEFFVTLEIQALCIDRVFQHFYEICQIPHGSGNEKGISDFLLNWARGLGLEVEQDGVLNVLVRKPASPGREGHPSVMLQAHMDMVCEKAVGVDHDFTKDSIQWVIDGDILSTGGRTTLGADDGIGVALAMSILEDGQLSHPDLEVLFTVMEEEDFSGAENFDVSRMYSSYLINLDHTVDHEIVCGSCGGMRVDFWLSADKEPIPEDWATYRLSVSGLKGGHSGEDIHRGRGNATLFLARLLITLEDHCEFRLGSLQGGSFRLAIPRDAEAVVALHPNDVPAVSKALEELENELRGELSVTGACLEVSFEQTAPVSSWVQPEAVLSAITLLPDGICQMNEMLTGLVDTSDNLGEVYLTDGELHCIIEIRSARNSLRTYLFQQMERLAKLLEGRCELSHEYPSWSFHADSKLRQLCIDTYQNLYGTAPTILTVHAGLEVGYFSDRKQELDAISIGPNCRDFHSPTEALQISSVKKSYQYLCVILASIR